MEAQTIWTVVRDWAVEVLTVCLAAFARIRAGNRRSWSAALGVLIRDAGKGLSA
jgi:hypothetical protein